MNDALSTIRCDLQQEQERLSTIREGLKSQLRDAEHELKRVGSALAALADRPTTKASTRASKPCASKSEVIAIVERLLQEEPVITVDHLRQKIERRVISTGKSRMGLALRIKEALATPLFAIMGDGVHLASADRPRKQQDAPKEVSNASATPTN